MRVVYQEFIPAFILTLIFTSLVLALVIPAKAYAPGSNAKDAGRSLVLLSSLLLLPDNSPVVGFATCRRGSGVYSPTYRL